MTSRRLVATLCLAALLLALVSPTGLTVSALPSLAPVLGVVLTVAWLRAEPAPTLHSPLLPEPAGRGPPEPA